ncbi:hypothetical protein P8C59_005290 [Phyllachora maydis]|uniref:Uncharacterized protein n=1 Tax=Phyllachora maydis TaxID=1825666 RepID=A0AAD9I454_9PEZI|nr:hypothetical protein P8C59_005290 [Phyllachora maydis]
MQKMASLAALSQLQFPRARANKALRPSNPALPIANDNNNNPLSQPLSTDYLNDNTEMEDRQTTTIAPTTAKETAIGAITTVPTVVAVKGFIVYNWVIEEGLLEEAKKQHPTAGYRAKKPLPTLGHPAAATATKLTIPA